MYLSLTRFSLSNVRNIAIMSLLVLSVILVITKFEEFQKRTQSQKGAHRRKTSVILLLWGKL